MQSFLKWQSTRYVFNHPTQTRVLLHDSLPLVWIQPNIHLPYFHRFCVLKNIQAGPSQRCSAGLMSTRTKLNCCNSL